MTLNEIIAEVYTLTGRPDLVTETSAAVRKATLKMHSIDYFYRDLQETIIGFPVAAYKQQYDLGVNIPSYRAIKFVREWNQVHAGNERYLNAVEPDAIVSNYGREFTDIWYVAGTMLNLKCTNLITNLVIGYYKHPDIATNTYSSWIAIEQPFAIIEEACANIFQMIGHAEMARKFEQLSRDNMILLRQNYLESQAR
jgi:hypothetical protein